MQSDGQQQRFLRHDTGGSSTRRLSLFSRGFVLWTQFCLRLPAVITLIAILLAVCSGIYATRNLGYKVSRIDLLDPDSEYNKLWIDYIAEFGDDDDAVIVVEGQTREEVIQVLEEVSHEAGERSDLFHSVLHEVDLSTIRGKGLHYLSPSDLTSIEQFIEQTQPIIDRGWSRLRASSMIAGMASQMVAGKESQLSGSPESLAAVLERYAESLLAGVEGSSRGNAPLSMPSPWPSMPVSLSTLRDLSSEHLLAKDGLLGFVLLRLTKTEGGFAGASVATDELRQIIKKVSDRHPSATIGLTGLPIMEDDEMRTSQQSMIWASGLSLAAVALVITAGFGGIRHALMANGVLVIAMSWAFGWATVSVGHLNILSVTFTVTMIGVGIDYGTYYVARYLQCRRRGLDCDDALLETSGAVGPSILTG
ncbi:MAG: MMPL family transporter, partial [Pirellulales bacterium]|nr:MMPL family transporter [Pirellulales bacterium]